MTFTSDLKRFKTKTEEKMDRAVRKIVLDMFSHCILMSPVGNMDLWENPPRGKADDVIFPSAEGYVGGRFRGNWQPSIGSTLDGELEVIDASGQATISKVSGVLKGAKAGDIIYLTNNLPYAIPLEEGHSRQAPKGMVRLTVQRAVPIANQIIAQIGAE